MLIKPKSEGVYEALFKLIMIGDSGTGKSCLINRYMKNEFDLDYKVTIGKLKITKVWNLLQKKLKLTKIIELNFKSGTLLGRRVFEVLLKVSIEMQLPLSSFTVSQSNYR